RGTGAWNDGAQEGDFPLGEGIAEAAGEGKLVLRKYPVRVWVELPVGMAVGLLQAVVGPHAELDRNEVGLDVRKVIARGRKADFVAIDCEKLARRVVMASDVVNRDGVGRGHLSELRVPVGPWGSRIGNDEVVDHPSFVPARLVVDDKQPRDAREDVDEGSRIFWIPRETGLRLEHETDRGDRRQPAIRAVGSRRDRADVDVRNSRGEDIRLELSRVEQEVT